MATEYTRLLKRFCLRKVEVPQQSYSFYEKRTKGFLEAEMLRMPIDLLPQAIRRFGFSCYLQGAIDGAQAGARNPNWMEEVHGGNDTEKRGEDSVEAVGQVLPGQTTTVDQTGAEGSEKGSEEGVRVHPWKIPC